MYSAVTGKFLSTDPLGEWEEPGKVYGDQSRPSNAASSGCGSCGGVTQAVVFGGGGSGNLPAKYADGPNVMAYCKGNPVSGLDPMGTAWKIVIAAYTNPGGSQKTTDIDTGIVVSEVSVSYNKYSASSYSFVRNVAGTISLTKSALVALTVSQSTGNINATVSPGGTASDPSGMYATATASASGNGTKMVIVHLYSKVKRENGKTSVEAVTVAYSAVCYEDDEK